MRSMTQMSILLLVVVLVGCASPTPATPSRSGAPAAEQPAAPARQGPKTINMTVKAEPNVLITNLDTVGATAYANGAIHYHLNSYLTMQDPNDRTMPIIAEALPSLDNGSIRLVDDGTMVTTWKIRPNVKWHDGAPFTSTDVAFSWKVALHPSWPVRNAVARQITGIETPDPQTIVMTWREPSLNATALTRNELDFFPAHKLEAAWTENPEDFPKNPHFSDTSVFVGTGAFRAVSWDRGSQMTIEAFPDYFLGKPKIDRIIFKFILDPRVAISNLLAGAVDVVNNGLGYDEVQVIENQWRATNGGTTTITFLFNRFLFIQFRPEEARPHDLATDVQVRRALMHGIDRAQLADGISPGSGDRFVSHAPTPPGVGPGDALDRATTKYNYDPNRTQQLLQDAGWTRGPDGILTKGGERFVTEMRNSNLTEGDRAFQLIQFDWRKIGVDLASFDNQSTFTPVDYAIFPGFVISTSGMYPKIDSRNLATAANRWSGPNGSAYSNPMYNRLYDEYLRSVRVEDQNRNLAEAWRVANDDVASMPLYFFPNAAAIRRGVDIPVPQTTQLYWDNYKWDMQ